MDKRIIDRITKLGGKSAFEGENLLNNMESISLPKSYLMQDFSDYLENDLQKEQPTMMNTPGLFIKNM